ncbi:hypothetical protein PtA15_5A333 [Puccinia triticina]|uniref:Uncharacterized protein n=1 Tax=Puccinia triticina TaxID=208348 RepID=A0ABY7CI44_9BASI|nr:uncharacterized protein PtA15_5A333 [Puccinia triticina]WAQ84760.1 hypothetical protein PtA15_5A333 [Puccinia triticina]
MVNTRRDNPQLTGPLPPPTRAKRPKQTKAYKALLQLPPLPPSPIEEKIDPLDHDRPPSPFVSAISYIFSKVVTRHIDDGTLVSATVLPDNRVVRNPFGLPISQFIPPPGYRPKINIPRDTSPPQSSSESSSTVSDLILTPISPAPSMS